MTLQRHCVYENAKGLPRELSGKESTAKQETRFNPWVGKTPWRRKWQPL